MSERHRVRSGFYINGNATISLSATTGGNGTSNPTQTYTITQGSTVTTIIVDNSSGKTSVISGNTSLSLQGVPSQLDPNTGQPISQTDPSGQAVNPTLGLSGTVQNNVGITVAAPGNVSITGDLTLTLGRHGFRPPFRSRGSYPRLHRRQLL